MGRMMLTIRSIEVHHPDLTRQRDQESCFSSRAGHPAMRLVTNGEICQDERLE